MWKEHMKPKVLSRNEREGIAILDEVVDATRGVKEVFVFVSR
jgi:hypothetical protein